MMFNKLGVALSLAMVLGGLASTTQAEDHSATYIIEARSSKALTSVLGSTVIPYKEVTLSAQTPGLVKYVGGEVGTAFNRGAPLAQIDESTLMAQRNAILAQIQTAQASLQTSQAQYTRELISPRSKDIGMMPGFGLPAMMDQFMTQPMAEAFMGGYNSDMARYSDLVGSASKVSQARSSLQQAYSRLQEIDAGLRNTQSIAPFEGIIMEKLVEVGDTVQPGQPLLRYGFVKYKRLEADVPSGMVGSLKQDMQVDVRIDGYETMTKAKVAQIYPIANPERHTITVKFDLELGANAYATPGMYAEIYLPTGEEKNNKIVIPQSALLSGRSLPSVLVKKGDSSELRLIRLGREIGNDMIEVLSGLEVGNQVYSNPPATAASGWRPPSTQTADAQ